MLFSYIGALMQPHPEPSTPSPSPTLPEDDEFFSLRITLQTIKLLDAVVRHGSIAAAATSLSMPAANLSAALHSLETGLGLTLFYPASTPMQPTPACQALLDEGRLLLQTQAADGNPTRQPPGP